MFERVHFYFYFQLQAYIFTQELTPGQILPTALAQLQSTYFLELVSIMFGCLNRINKKSYWFQVFVATLLGYYSGSIKMQPVRNRYQLEKPILLNFENGLQYFVQNSLSKHIFISNFDQVTWILDFLQILDFFIFKTDV